MTHSRVPAVRSRPSQASAREPQQRRPRISSASWHNTFPDPSSPSTARGPPFLLSMTVPVGKGADSAAWWGEDRRDELQEDGRIHKERTLNPCAPWLSQRRPFVPP